MKADRGKGGAGFEGFGQRRGTNTPNLVAAEVDFCEGGVGFQRLGQRRGASAPIWFL